MPASLLVSLPSNLPQLDSPFSICTSCCPSHLQVASKPSANGLWTLLTIQAAAGEVQPHRTSVCTMGRHMAAVVTSLNRDKINDNWSNIEVPLLPFHKIAYHASSETVCFMFLSAGMLLDGRGRHLHACVHAFAWRMYLHCLWWSRGCTGNKCYDERNPRSSSSVRFRSEPLSVLFRVIPVPASPSSYPIDRPDVFTSQFEILNSLP